MARSITSAPIGNRSQPRLEIDSVSQGFTAETFIEPVGTFHVGKVRLLRCVLLRAQVANFVVNCIELFLQALQLIAG